MSNAAASCLTAQLVTVLGLASVGCDGRLPEERALEAAAPEEYEAWRTARDATDAAMDAAGFGDGNRSTRRLLIEARQNRHALQRDLADIVGITNFASACEQQPDDPERPVLGASREEGWRIHRASVAECFALDRLVAAAGAAAWVAFAAAKE